jgi:hypothetical protein
MMHNIFSDTTRLPYSTRTTKPHLFINATPSTGFHITYRATHFFNLTPFPSSPCPANHIASSRSSSSTTLAKFAVAFA